MRAEPGNQLFDLRNQLGNSEGLRYDIILVADF
jgi:hypothetical protein